MPDRHLTPALLACLVGGLFMAPPAQAQSELSRTINIESPQTTPQGTLRFAYTHRFLLQGGAVSNSPTFILSTGLSPSTSLGLAYATETRLGYAPLTAFTRAVPPNNEFELSFKQALLHDKRRGVDLAAMVGYDTTANSGDVAAIISRDLGPFMTILGTVREFTNGFGAGGYTSAAGLGLQLHLTKYLDVTEDVSGVLAAQHAGALLDPNSTLYYSNLPAWSLGVDFRIPYSPHTMQIYMTNADTTTLEGSSRGVLDSVSSSGAKQSDVRVGFAFDIPFSDPGRWLAIVQPPRAAEPHGAASPPALPAGSIPAGGASTAVPVPGVAPAAVPKSAIAIAIQNFAFAPATVRVPTGATVQWRNADSVAHTVTADDGSFGSQLIDPGTTYRHTFTRPGTYTYHCTPHPFMKGTVIVL